MRDICVLRYSTLTSVRVTSSLIREYTLLLTGKNLTFTNRVVVNEINAPDFSVLSDTKVEVLLPESVRDQVVTSVAVYVETSRPEFATDMEIELTQDSRSGLMRLSQSVVKLLLTTPGSDIFDPTSGGGLERLIRGVSLDDTALVTGVVNGAVQRTKAQILKSQGSKVLPAEEKLVDLRVVNINVDKTTLTVAIRLQIITRGAIVELSLPMNKTIG
jgi:phage baseplate assembly protein W